MAKMSNDNILRLCTFFVAVVLVFFSGWFRFMINKLPFSNEVPVEVVARVAPDKAQAKIKKNYDTKT